MSVSARTLAPLMNMDIGEAEIEFVTKTLTRLVLRRGSLTTIDAEFADQLNWDQADLLDSDGQVWVTVEHAHEDRDIVWSHIQDLVTAIRLTKNEPIWCPALSTRTDPVVVNDVPTVRITAMSYGNRWDAIETWSSVGACRIGKREADKVSKVLTEIPRARQHKRLGLALRRFDMALDRASMEDAIVDMCISLEAILGDPNVTDVGLYLEKKWQSVVSRRDDLGIADHYKKRNAIVHGTGKKFDPTPTAASLASDLAKMLRRLVLEPKLVDLISEERRSLN